MLHYGARVAGSDPDLDKRLSDELDRVNAAATPGVQPARELTVRLVDEEEELAAGVSGWTWGLAAGIAMTWVHPEVRGEGLGSQLLAEFEREARNRGCTQVFVTSFTFQAPEFYQRHGYEEIFRWEGVPTLDAADVHMRKEFGPSSTRGCMVGPSSHGPSAGQRYARRDQHDEVRRPPDRTLTRTQRVTRDTAS